MRKPSTVISKIVILALLFASATAAVAAEPFLGKWKLNLSRSEYKADQAPRSYEVYIKRMDGGLKGVATRLEADGKKSREEWSAKYDGLDYPMSGDPAVDTVALKRIDDGTLEITFKKSGKEIERSRVVVSPDRKITTVTAKAKDEKGRDFVAVLILEKQ
jgi:hypothetical protein